MAAVAGRVNGPPRDGSASPPWPRNPEREEAPKLGDRSLAQVARLTESRAMAEKLAAAALRKLP
jgi:hypothetical protein